MRFLTLSQCCCGMENGGQRGWDDPCTPCPVKGTGRLNCAVESFHSGEVARVLPSVASCYTLELSPGGAILVPRAHDPSGLRQESRAPGATISGMRYRCRLRETGWAEFGYFLCYFKMVAPRALVFRPLVKGNEDSGNETVVAL